ncbi:unnamed protein product [Echinostoma caproni]|uniref:TPH domain-containing protein n=1 Tax=Echinostoma caproni TaxID=27848 RepID=A0A183AHG3_9TREM|nr:unnamed protein product [Echinostoma caproni]
MRSDSNDVSASIWLDGDIMPTNERAVIGTGEKLVRRKLGSPKCVDTRNVTVFSQSEWKRLKDQIHGDVKEIERIEQKRKAQEEVHKSSQEMGARQKKLDDRAKRLAKEEEAKVAIDLEEAKYQAQQRKAAIDEAKLKIYYQTDRIKTFHSALALTEVLKEREAQIEFKNLCKKLDENKDKVYVERMKREIEEGKIIFIELIMTVCEEDEQCRLFAAAKKKMIEMRVLRERAMFKEREEQLEKIRLSLAEQMAVAKRDEEERISKAIAEREAAEMQKEQEKAKKLAEMLTEIEKHRVSQIQQKRKEMEVEKMAELEEVRVRAAAERAITEYEAACSEAKLKRYRELSEEYLQQTNKKQEEKKASRVIDAQTYRTGNRLAQIEEEVFQDYTRRVIDHCKANGRNIYPLEVAARPTGNIGLGSSLPGEVSIVNLAQVQGDAVNSDNNNNNSKSGDKNNNNAVLSRKTSPSTKNGKKNAKDQPGTNKRLGFVW